MDYCIKIKMGQRGMMSASHARRHLPVAIATAKAGCVLGTDQPGLIPAVTSSINSHGRSRGRPLHTSWELSKAYHTHYNRLTARD